MNPVGKSWDTLREFLKGHAPAQFRDLNPPCPETEITRVESTLDSALPAPLRALYLANNGQKGHAGGLFPGEPNACRFLPLGDAGALWEKLRNDREVDVFDVLLIPFATDGAFDVYCAHAESGIIYFLWTGGPDIFLPNVWQTKKEPVATSLAEFLHDTYLRLANPESYTDFLIGKACHSESKDVRKYAVGTLAASGNPRAVDILRGVLHDDPHPSVRYTAAFELRKLGDGQAQKDLRFALDHDSDPAVRTECMRALYKQGVPDLAPSLIAWIQSEKDRWVRFEIAKILGKLAKRGPVPAQQAIPIITEDLRGIDQGLSSLKFHLAIALLRLEGAGGVAQSLFEQMKAAGQISEDRQAKWQKVRKRMR